MGEDKNEESALSFMSFMNVVAKTQEENLALIKQVGEMSNRLEKIDQKLARIAEWIPANYKGEDK